MLNIYKASAGSGKTHLLTGEYIKLLFRKDLLPESADHPTRFNEILAVTFTNKATAEMKARIIEELDVLSKDPSKSDYYKEINNDGKGGELSDEQIRDKAKGFLTDILNNYSEFAISTIDSFFQKIVRSFARELNLQCNYEVELNSNRILDSAVSRFLDKLDFNKNKDLFNWMIQFSQKKIEEGSGWRLEKDLLQLTKSVLTSEAYRSRSGEIEDITKGKKWLNDYIDYIKKLKKDIQDELRNIGKEGLDILDKAGFTPTDFKGGEKSAMRIFESLNNGEIKGFTDSGRCWAESEDNWYKKETKKEPVRRLPSEPTEKILALLRRILAMESDELINYYTAKSILDTIYQLGILADIDKEINEFCNEEGSILISNTTELLNKLIGTDDAPFIYEKTGTNIQSFMIDEFQDTSNMQWGNFKPLIENALSNGRENLIVGDVKQSIYRWRGSEWGLLYNGLRDFAIRQTKEDVDTLRTNYRAQPVVVDFNNDFFKEASHKLSDFFCDSNIKEIYSDVEQEKRPSKEGDTPGYINVKFFETEKENSFEDAAMDYLPQAVIDLEDAGFQAKDIAILCRTKKICKKAADALLLYKTTHPEDTVHSFDIISNEALLLCTRKVVQTIISILYYIQNPQSKINKAIASCNYLQSSGLSEEESVKQCFAKNADIDRFLEFSNRSLYDMLEGITSLLPKEALKDIAFIQAFRDSVLEFSNNKKSDLSAFLEWWELYGKDLCINTPEGQNAIKIMTIHKAKGLGMPAIILPCTKGTFNIDSKSKDILWCSPEGSTFGREGLVLPIKWSGALTNTIFKKDFEKERLKVVIDNLNTAYVAFTRAKEAMVILSPVPSKSSKDIPLEKLLFDYCGNNKDFVVGELSKKQNGKRSRDNDLETETISETSEGAITQRKIPALSLKQNKLTADIQAIEKGNCIHDILANVIDYVNIDKPIEEMFKLGKVDQNLFSCNDIRTEIQQLLSIEEIREWFVPGITVLNERSILQKSNNGSSQSIYRPDRVVIKNGEVSIIDYKTGSQLKKHIYQVRKYMELLSQMGFSKINGYLLYIYPYQLVKVNMRSPKNSQ